MARVFYFSHGLLVSFIGLICCVIYPVTDTNAGGGHDHGEGFGSASALTHFELTDAAISNLGINSVPARLEKIEDVYRLPAQLTLLPEKQAMISPRFAGEVSKVLVQIGDEVKKGETLLEIQPLAVGASSVKITSPIQGRIIEQNVVPGEILSAGQRALVVADSSELFARGFSYQSSVLSRIKVGRQAEFIIDVLPGERLTGLVKQVGPTLDSDDRTFSVYVLIDNSRGLLLPHFQGELLIQLGNPETLLVVPEAAILGSTGKNFLFVREGLSFERRHVELGVKKGDVQEVISGVFPGEEVVVRGNYQLQFVTEEGDSPLTDDHHGHSH